MFATLARTQHSLEILHLDGAELLSSVHALDAGYMVSF
jgi:hypothetical protein